MSTTAPSSRGGVREHRQCVGNRSGRPDDVGARLPERQGEVCGDQPVVLDQQNPSSVDSLHYRRSAVESAGISSGKVRVQRTPSRVNR